MATIVRAFVIDDLDASTVGVGTYRFALEGVEYEIDLSEPNLDRLRDALQPFIANGRRLPRRNRATPRGDAAGRRAKPATEPMRAWWAANTDREDLPPFRTRGVIPQQVKQAYQLAKTQAQAQAHTQAQTQVDLTATGG